MVSLTFNQVQLAGHYYCWCAGRLGGQDGKIFHLMSHIHRLKVQILTGLMNLNNTDYGIKIIKIGNNAFNYNF